MLMSLPTCCLLTLPSELLYLLKTHQSLCTYRDSRMSDMTRSRSRLACSHTILTRSHPQLARSHPHLTRSHPQGHLLGEVRSLVGHAVHPEEPLMGVGVDSRAAMELRASLASSTGLTLPPTLLYDYQTVAGGWFLGACLIAV